MIATIRERKFVLRKALGTETPAAIPEADIRAAGTPVAATRAVAIPEAVTRVADIPVVVIPAAGIQEAVAAGGIPVPIWKTIRSYSPCFAAPTRLRST